MTVIHVPPSALNTHVNVRPGDGKVPIRWYPIVDVFEKFVLAASQPSYLHAADVEESRMRKNNIC